MTKYTFTNQTSIVILAAPDSSGAVQLSLLNQASPVALNAGDKLKFRFPNSKGVEEKVYVQIISPTNTPTFGPGTGTAPTMSSGTLPSSGPVALYYLTAMFDLSSDGTSLSDINFTIGISRIPQPADPTVIISRGGTGDFALSTGSRPG